MIIVLTNFNLYDRLMIAKKGGKLDEKRWEDEYMKMEGEAWEIYHRVKNQAWEEYVESSRPALERCQAIQKEAWEKLQRILGAIENIQ